ncbi:NADH dehydrogenase [ubiquinone] 1 beta subcomplex subunit 4 [Orchesella cincta]|uniref:NADH dehydrogenase [ubiquinone] 1 beta subcomplex subunit 4 n=1 Tax=Orchesella cincta TaxID=48709 RepID=A0A1D2MBU3_ORCCI|nr:NADH dehydrogenase [ubiquinone] 1 beta subcomplex subunit 4 [Orchesella cincta]
MFDAEMPINLPAQYDASPKEQRLVEDRARLRAEFRKEYVKQITNPHRHGHGGYLFDPALQRWQSMRAQQYYYFKPNVKTGLWSAFIVFTCFAYGKLFGITRAAKEKEFRTGMVSYADREFKFA